MVTDPVLAYARPDVEALVWSTITPLVPKDDATSWAYSAHDASTPAGWLSIVSVQVDVRAKYKQAAYAKADAVRRAVQGLVGGPWPLGVVNRVDVTEGPFFQSDVTGRPRYITRFDLWVHPRPQPARRNKESTQ